MDGQDLFFQKAISALLEKHRGERKEVPEKTLKDLDKNERDLWDSIANALKLVEK